MSQDVINLVPLTPEQIEELERLAALGYSVYDMAIYFDKPLIQFRADANTDGSIINYRIKRGKTMKTAKADMQLMKAAEAGNLTAIQQLAKATAKNEYKDMLRQMYDEDDEL